MFGLFRTVLALAVVAEHLGGAHWTGPYAVFGFYVLSGYLMTMILHQTYGYSLRGFGRYAMNRWLRIFPIYYVAAAITVLLVMLLGDDFVRAFHPDIGAPRSIEEVVRNLALVLSIHTDTRWVAPAWALTVECVFYLLIGLGASRYWYGTLAWLSISLVYTGYLVMGDASWSYRYFTVAAASLPFALGATVFHLKQQQRLGHPMLHGDISLAVLLVLLGANYALGAAGGIERIMGLHFYANLVLMVLVIINLSSRRQLGPVGTALNKRLGDLSYPIYLMHYQAGLMLAALTPLLRGEWLMALAATPLVIAMGLAANRLIEHPINRVRARLRSG